MGKFERDWAELAEQNTAAGIRGEAVDTADQLIADAVRVHVESLFHNRIETARWVGAESYEDAGDIHVFLSNGAKIPVELKASRANGAGTKANPSTNILKKYIAGAENYPDHDAAAGYLKARYDLIETATGSRPAKASHYQKTLRGLRDSGRTDIVERIAEITRPGQESYAAYAADLMNQHIAETQQMVNDILDGNNTTQNTATDDLVYCVVKNYQKPSQTVEFYDFAAMDSRVATVVSEGSSIKIQNAAGYDILRFSVTWKNICQGGATPCFNVFVGNAKK
jgi:hypothetical protein